jgi:hypothetical protein
MNDKFSPDALRDSIQAILSRTIDDQLKRLTASAPILAASPAVSSVRYSLIPLVGHSSSSILQKLSSSERTKGVLKRYTTEA